MALIRRGEIGGCLRSVLPLALDLAFNIYWLWVFGTLVEQVYGHLKTAAFIVLFALGSGSLEFALARGGVGLSGVGYGLFGLLWGLLSHDVVFPGCHGWENNSAFRRVVHSLHRDNRGEHCACGEYRPRRRRGSWHSRRHSDSYASPPYPWLLRASPQSSYLASGDPPSGVLESTCPGKRVMRKGSGAMMP